MASTKFAWIDRAADRITYCTDVEGHWQYFCSYVELSSALSFKEKGDHKNATVTPTLVLKDGWQFVFGGDSCDKGPGTIRFLEAVVALKKKHPERVHLLLGNRDVNKMRWTSELDPAYIAKLSQETPGAYWVGERTRKKPYDHIKVLAANAEGKPEEEVTEEMIKKHNTVANRMRFHLTFDMGSDGEFDFRRQEMALMLKREAASITDDEVMESYTKSLAKGGFMREYLENSELVCLLGDTLFVHGQIISNQFSRFPGDVQSIKVVPDMEGGGYTVVEKLEEWVQKLNEWSAAQVAQWIAEPTFKTLPKDATLDGWAGRGGADLISYGTPVSRHPTVVYCRWLEDDNMPRPLPDDLVKYLVASRVRRVVVGHTPHGTCPTVIPHEGLSVVMADTSFSALKSNHAYAGDNRGDAVSEVIIEGEVCTVKGRTGMGFEKEGKYVKMTFSEVVDYKAPPSGDANIGAVQPVDPKKPDEPRFFVKAKILNLSKQQTKYLLCHCKGFVNTYLEVDEQCIIEKFPKGELPEEAERLCSITSHGNDFGAGLGQESDVVKRLFAKLDKDGDGDVSISEILSACADPEVRDAMAWSFPKDISLETAFKQMDTNNNNRISSEELENAICYSYPMCYAIKRAQPEICLR